MQEAVVAFLVQRVEAVVEHAVLFAHELERAADVGVAVLHAVAAAEHHRALVAPPVAAPGDELGVQGGGRESEPVDAGAGGVEPRGQAGQELGRVGDVAAFDRQPRGDGREGPALLGAEQAAAAQFPGARIGHARIRPTGEEAPQFAQHVVRFFFRQEVAAIERAAAHVPRHLAPVGERLEHHLDDALLAPQDHHRHAQFLLQVFFVVHQVDARGRPVVLAGAVDGLRIAERAHVFRQGIFVEDFYAARAAPDAAEDVMRNLFY